MKQRTSQIDNETVKIYQERRGKEEKDKAQPYIAHPGHVSCEKIEPDTLRPSDDNWRQDHYDKEEGQNYAYSRAEVECCPCPQEDMEM